VDRAAAIDRELLIRPAPQRTTLGRALNLLAGAALRYRDRFGVAVPVWALIGSFAHGRLLAPPHPAAQLKSGVPPGPAMPGGVTHCADQPRPRTPGDRHFADHAVTSQTTPPISVFIHDESINGKRTTVNITSGAAVSLRRAVVAACERWGAGLTTRSRMGAGRGCWLPTGSDSRGSKVLRGRAFGTISRSGMFSYGGW